MTVTNVFEGKTWGFIFFFLTGPKSFKSVSFFCENHLKIFVFRRTQMDFHGFVRIPLCGGHSAFDAITSEDGAKHFRDIGKYTKYSRVNNIVNVEYTSIFGTTSQEMTIGYRIVTFRGKGPMGVTFGGSWTHLSDGIHLEQTVWGIPRLMSSIVQKRVNRALEDLQKLV